MDISEHKSPAAEVTTKDPQSEKAQFLSQFTAEDDRRIMRKVDRRVLLLMGIMYLLKQIDFTNAASVKVLQVGEPSNIMTELQMSTNDYNWTQTIYYVRPPIHFEYKTLTKSPDRPRPLRSLQKPAAQTPNPPQMDDPHLPNLGSNRRLPRCDPQQGLLLHAALPPRRPRGRLLPWPGRPNVRLVPQRRIQPAHHVDVRVPELLGDHRLTPRLRNSYMDGIRGLSAWRWVFLLEGLVTILFCPAIYFLLPDYPKSKTSAKWLTPEEQEYLEQRLSDNAPRATDPDFSLPEIVNALKDPKMYLFTTCQFLLNIAGYGLSWQLPTITTSLGFASLPRNQLLNIPPAAATVVGIIIAARFMRYAVITRPLFCQILNVVTLLFFVILCIPVPAGGRYAACVLGTAFYYVYFIPFWAWRSAGLVGATGTAFAIALQTALAQVGGVIAPQVFQGKYASDDYRVSFIVCVACVVGAMVSGQVLWYLSRGVEKDVMHVRKRRIAAGKDGMVWTGGM